MTLPGWLPIAPVVLAAASGVLLVAIESAWPRLARALGGTLLAAQLALALVALAATAGGSPLAYQWAPWPAPAGLTVVLDPLSAWMLLATMLCALVAVASGSAARDAAGRRRHSLLQFQLLGFAGMFLVSDLVSLFVCYGGVWLLTCAGVARHAVVPRARRAVFAGAIALGVAIGCIFASTGTFDLAGLALAAPAVPAADGTLLTSGAFALLALLALGAAAPPLVLWWPVASARVPAAALVLGSALAASAVYAILRLFTLAFPCFIAGPCGPSGLALPLGLSILTAGALATLAVRHARAFISGLMVLSIGLVIVAVGSFRVAGLAAGIYLLMHATLAGAAILVTLERVAQRGTLRPSGGSVLLYGVALAAMLCLPPLPGFLGSVALLRGSGPDALAVWTLVLSSMLVALIATVRSAQAAAAREALDDVPAAPGGRAAAVAAVGLLLVLSLAAGPAFEVANTAARQLLDRNAYVSAVAAARGRSASRDPGADPPRTRG